MRAFSYTWSVSVMWQRWQSQHSICHSRKPHTTRKTSWLYVLQIWSYGRWKFYIAGICIFDHFCSCDLDLDPITFIYEFHEYSLEIYRTLWK